MSFVDLLVVMHNESGGECGSSSNIWSHSRDYRNWPVSGNAPYETNDTSANGGLIMVTDYAIQPALDCSVDTVDIGGLCHEIGHALGIPDLFDDDGGSSGIGDWGLMGSGQWNSPASPAHPCAWTRMELGWVSVVDVGSAGSVEAIPDIETTATCFRLAFSGGHFNRMSECAITGSFSMRCGIDATEAATRGWEGGAGYGNNWDETIERKFTFDGTTPVTFAYLYEFDLEFGYDSVFVSICVDTAETLLASYTGVGSGTESIDLSAILSPLGSDTCYTLKFRVVSDQFNSDEDGDYPSTCGALVVDNIAVTGGGESYLADFESHGGGWYLDPAKHISTEYWLVENRQASGFDANLHGSGLVLYHVDDAVLKSKLGNSGGSADGSVRGIVVEEADGNFELLQDPATTGNQGDAGDPFPGSTNNTTFDVGTVPGATDNSTNATIIEVSSIGASGSPMSAFLRAGDFPPGVDSITPSVMDNDVSPMMVTVGGTHFGNGASFRLEKTGEPHIIASGIVWQDAGTVQGALPIYGRKGGAWDLIVVNPDGREDTLVAAVILNEIVAAQLAWASIRAHAHRVELQFVLLAVEPGERFFMYRSELSGKFERLDGSLERGDDDRFTFIDDSVLPGKTYTYKLDVRGADGATRELYRGTATTPSKQLTLEQNHPNPFNPVTTISFYLPTPQRVQLDIFDVSGALVRTLVSGHASAGSHNPVWDGKDRAGNPAGSGVYFYKLTAGKSQLTRKMILLK
jgi:hypothetical protein